MAFTSLPCATALACDGIVTSVTLYETDHKRWKLITIVTTANPAAAGQEKSRPVQPLHLQVNILGH
jgi:hypothetical protein